MREMWLRMESISNELAEKQKWMPKLYKKTFIIPNRKWLIEKKDRHLLKVTVCLLIKQTINKCFSEFLIKNSL